MSFFVPKSENMSDVFAIDCRDKKIVFRVDMVVDDIQCERIVELIESLSL